MFLNILEILKTKLVSESLFNKVLVSRPETLLKRYSHTGAFLSILHLFHIDYLPKLQTQFNWGVLTPLWCSFQRTCKLNLQLHKISENLRHFSQWLFQNKWIIDFETTCNVLIYLFSPIFNRQYNFSSTLGRMELP